MLDYTNILNKVKKIHFIGIGGSGMCPLADILHAKGFEISGSDNYESDTLKGLINKGVKIFETHAEQNIEGADLIVYSAAIKKDNPELIAAEKNNIPALERSVMLGILCDEYENLVAIAGSHGKTTTTSMITQILIDAKADPTAIIGGKVHSINSNSIVGKSQNMVCEACEYVDTFLHLHPAISVITNIDNDHLDYFGTLQNLIKSFNKFASQTSKVVLVNGDNENSIKAIQNISTPVITFGFGEQNTYRASIISENNKVCESFYFIKNNEKLCKISLSVPGKYNVYNALAAASVADFMGIDADIIANSLSSFSGVHRRFEILGTPNNITVADDFAHHPTEIKSVLSAAMKMGYRKVYAVFQPHTYSRTAMLLSEFADVLSIADHVVLSEILAVREINTYNISSEDLAAKIKNCTCLVTFDEIADYIEKNAMPGDLILTMGGGNVYVCANMIVYRLSKKYSGGTVHA